MHIELIPGKAFVKIYNRSFTKSSHNYLLKHASIEEVAQNYKAILSDLKASRLSILEQVHGADVADCSDYWGIGGEPKADAMVVSEPGVVLGIQTADCVPVLIASEDGRVVGAAHCGWRSALAGVLDNLEAEIRKKTNAKLFAVIGPSIAQESYEVERDMYLKFLEKSIFYERFFTKKNDEKWLFDPSGFVKQCLSDLNINLVKHFDEDTYTNPELYPSYRYACHNGFRYKGSILSTIHII